MSLTDKKPSDVIVVGGGPSGLAAAFRLKQAGARVRILEMSDRVGGKMRTTARDGYLIDQGAFFVPTTHRTLLGLAAEAGMADQVVEGGFILATMRDGHIHNIDGNRILSSVLSTKLLSVRAKFEAIKLVPEVWKARDAGYDRLPNCSRYDTQTLANWSQGRLSDELYEYLIDATLRGIFATSAETASRIDFLAIIALFKGAKLVAFRKGMGSYAEKLVEGVDVRLGAQVLCVELMDNGVSVTWKDEQGQHNDKVSACVVAVPAKTTRAILPKLDPWRRNFLDKVSHGKTFVLNVGLRRSPLGVTATYIQVPKASHPFITGILLDHHKAPDRAPEGKGLLSIAVLNSWCEQVWQKNDDDISEMLLQALETLLPGTKADVEFFELHRWFQEYNKVGFYKDLAEFRALGEHDERLQLAGDFHSMQNMDAATTTGLQAAERLISKGFV